MNEPDMEKLRAFAGLLRHIADQVEVGDSLAGHIEWEHFMSDFTMRVMYRTNNTKGQGGVQELSHP